MRKNATIGEKSMGRFATNGMSRNTLRMGFRTGSTIADITRINLLNGSRINQLETQYTNSASENASTTEPTINLNIYMIKIQNYRG